MIAYQIRQSFKPGEITAEEANRVGYELALAFTKGRHAFIVATHTDRVHIHNHIIFNSTSLDCRRKFHDAFRTKCKIRTDEDAPGAIVLYKNETEFLIQLLSPQKICAVVSDFLLLAIHVDGGSGKA